MSQTGNNCRVKFDPITGAVTTSMGPIAYRNNDGLPFDASGNLVISNGGSGTSTSTYSVGTKPTNVYGQPALVTGAWTLLWPADAARTFASVLGGTGTPGEVIYITANPLAAVADPDVAQIHGDAGALYFETRGVNALYGRLAADGPMTVRTSRSTSVARSPLPGGDLGVPDYRILTSCGGGAVTYTASGTTSYAPVLDHDESRLRVSLFADTAFIMSVQSANVPFDFIATNGIYQVAATGSFFPGSIVVEGTSAIRSLVDSSTSPQEHIFWIRDQMEALP